MAPYSLTIETRDGASQGALSGVLVAHEGTFATIDDATAEAMALLAFPDVMSVAIRGQKRFLQILDWTAL